MDNNDHSSAIEVRGFGKIRDLFAERQWQFPHRLNTTKSFSGTALISELNITPGQVEAIMINGRVQSFESIIKPGDRVALLPPGTPGPYRVLLGIVSRSKTPDNHNCR